MASLNLIRSVSSSSTRPGPRPTWRGGMAVRPGANGYAPESRSATGKPRPLSPASALPASSLRWCSTEQSNGEAFQLYVEQVLVSELRPGDIDHG
jgi:hypothetical protein